MMSKRFHIREVGEKKRRMYVDFMDLERAYNRVNRESLWQVRRMYDVGCKLLSRVKGMYVNILSCVRVKGSERVFQEL